MIRRECGGDEVGDVPSGTSHRQQLIVEHYKFAVGPVQEVVQAVVAMHQRPWRRAKGLDELREVLLDLVESGDHFRSQK